ncbi:MAG: hypothetical protein UU40_C0003G0040 [Candidatus Uhrbacteria bacterium GW2011_GWD2_41_121]|uniref:Uncharacterized protein n=1 Tax=Candidatus Uhrbacteria bacterium GW2011_GWC1_41_20 TaxID=1618983 RepID=A0A0G0VFK8_9BACT|nr:MAG: hypothetical protein UT52_C0003G0040 [Candidatus Uhrbacteria bacterium GW2011_GWE1_39_46]KKR64300.1 MAG: hypothetical protein UU04_C0003G0040 [Candidatus Uhrbacteria bacterium GW2011_GWC2_40_450]KKR90470.1 MAG: hypothetical protein UU40_C0003G0040 [Candidatus Uhrbacteria bacterium GW2011_GWD2_41_121]KKR96317.1 MAG: hypothetical protein UU46_C0004G0003 [Candidatus Uhrbacteria bacterium GW2011_GWD1_41_16]KKR99734.1 MAG: hypothetical protein UU50_C0003G0039 [Candidatus Uhrbacteria bacteriu
MRPDQGVVGHGDVEHRPVVAGEGAEPVSFAGPVVDVGDEPGVGGGGLAVVPVLPGEVQHPAVVVAALEGHLLTHPGEGQGASVHPELRRVAGDGADDLVGVVAVDQAIAVHVVGRHGRDVGLLAVLVSGQIRAGRGQQDGDQTHQVAHGASLAGSPPLGVMPAPPRKGD